MQKYLRPHSRNSSLHASLPGTASKALERWFLVLHSYHFEQRAPMTMVRYNGRCDTSFISLDRFHFCRTRDIWRWDTVSKSRCRWNREGVERVPKHVRVCAGHSPFRMQISASSLLLSAPNATRLFGVLGQSRLKLGNSKLVHIDPVQRSPHSIRLATS
jgi:hypothetical protein